MDANFHTIFVSNLSLESVAGRDTKKYLQWQREEGEGEREDVKEEKE